MIRLVPKIANNKNDYIGHSTDVKPITEEGQPLSVGSTFTELDGTQDVYLFDGITWVKFV